MAKEPDGPGTRERDERFAELRGRLATNLRRLRTAAGLSQASFAERAGIAPRYVVQLERGREGNPSLKLVAGLAMALGTDASELLKPAPPPEVRRPGRPRKSSEPG